MKIWISVIVLIGISLVLMPELLWGQGTPPGLPGTPDQAPIDGGLGAVALGAGAWAVKKLRNKKLNQTGEGK